MTVARASGQTTMPPTPGPVAGPTAAPPPIPVGGAVPSTALTPAPPANGRTRATMLMLPGGPVALDARSLRGTRTRSGYRLTGQALVKDACTAARFTQVLGNVFPPSFNVTQYRPPGTMGRLCIQRLTWVTIAPLDTTTAAPPPFVTVHTQKGSTRVPAPAGSGRKG